MTISLLRWRPRPLESGLTVKTCLLPTNFDREIDPIMQMAPLTEQGRQMILTDNYERAVPGYARAYAVQRPSASSGYEPCGLVVFHYRAIAGTILSRAPTKFLFHHQYDVEVYATAEVERPTWRTTVVTRKGVMSLHGKFERSAWWHLDRMLAAEDLPRAPKMDTEDLAFLAEVEV